MRSYTILVWYNEEVWILLFNNVFFGGLNCINSSMCASILWYSYFYINVFALKKLSRNGNMAKIQYWYVSFDIRKWNLGWDVKFHSLTNIWWVKFWLCSLCWPFWLCSLWVKFWLICFLYTIVLSQFILRVLCILRVPHWMLLNILA